MSIRNLEALFAPESVAVVGASSAPGSVGYLVVANLLGSGFAGPILPVNPRHRAVAGVWTYPDVRSLPTCPDLAIIATPPATVPGLIAELGDRGTRPRRFLPPASRAGARRPAPRSRRRCWRRLAPTV